MKAEGSFVVPADGNAVASLVTDLARFAPCIPGFDAIVAQGADEIAVRLKVGVGAIKGTMSTKLQITERLERGVRYRGTSTGLGSEAKVIASFDWTPLDGGTLVRWAGEAQNSGRLASLGKSLMDAVARKNVEAMMDNVCTTLGGGSGAASLQGGNR